MKPKAVIICPGRGTYNKAELGYITGHHSEKSGILAQFDEQRTATGQVSIRELDTAPRFSGNVHTRGDNASALIFTSSYMDSLDACAAFDVVAVTGNSMGWYTTLAVAGAARATDAFQIVNTMGQLMQESLIGGQTVYPVVGEDWRANPEARANLLRVIEEINAQDGQTLAVSIELGGMLVVAGDAAGLDAFEAAVPKVQGRFPLRLPNHSAFHTTLQQPVAARGSELLNEALFNVANIPMVDGRGVVWYPHSHSTEALRAYTLGAQVTETYDFTSAIRVAARTFAPDVFVVLGPGNTLGGAVAQSLINIEWQGLASKPAFQARQKEAPVILSMGRETDRARMQQAS